MSKKHYKSLPKSVKIGPREYKVRARDAVGDVGMERAYGYTNPEREIIVVRDDMSAGLLRETLLHEVMHAICNVSVNREAKVPEQEDDESYEEYQSRWEHFFIETYETGVLMVLRDNPELSEFLLAV